MTDVAQKLTGAENIRWNLTDLYSGFEGDDFKQDVATLGSQIASFKEKYYGKVTSLAAEELLGAIEEYEQISEVLGRMGTFASLAWVTDTTDPEAGKFYSSVQRQTTEMHQDLIFFDLEWKNASEEFAAIADTPALSKYSHYLKQTRLYAPYTLTEGEETVISELSLSGVQGWNRFFNEAMSNARYELDGKLLNQSEILQYLHFPDRDLRKRATDGMTEGLHKISHTTTSVFNYLAIYKRSTDKLRGYPSWITSRNLSNQVDDATVENLIDSVTSRYDIVARYYRLTKQLLGYDELYDYDRYAPIINETTEYSWDEARDVVLNAYAKFDGRMADIASMFFEKNWIDAAILPNKRGGAFSHPAVTNVHPYILVNYTGEDRSVMTLAHELGHGVHQYLSRQQGYLQAGTPLTTAEMASTFGEMLVFDSMMEQETNPKVRLSMRISKISDTFSTVFRQVALNRFEDGMHTACRTEGQLTTARLSEIWLQTQRAMFGDSLTIREEYGIWWSYIPHFLGSPGYVYAYAFGEMLVWSLYARYQAEGGDFSSRYLDALGKGGAVHPNELLAPLGINLQDPRFWHDGLQLMEDMVAQAEEEAAQL